MRILVTHHPFDVPEGHDVRKTVGRAAMAMEAIAECGVDLCLAGHLHVGHVGHPAGRTILPGRGPLLVHAGTATSTRERGEVNSFNVLRIDGDSLCIARYGWETETRAFRVAQEERYRRDERGWHARMPVP